MRHQASSGSGRAEDQAHSSQRCRRLDVRSQIAILPLGGRGVVRAQVTSVEPHPLLSGWGTHPPAHRGRRLPFSRSHANTVQGVEQTADTGSMQGRDDSCPGMRPLSKGVTHSYAVTLLRSSIRSLAEPQGLERIPDDKLEGQEHPKSHTIGWNANPRGRHSQLARDGLTEPSMDSRRSAVSVTRSEADQPAGGNHRDVRPKVYAARKAIAEVKDEEMGSPCDAIAAGQTFFTMPRAAVVRKHVPTTYAPQGPLCVYLG